MPIHPFIVVESGGTTNVHLEHPYARHKHMMQKILGFISSIFQMKILWFPPELFFFRATKVTFLHVGLVISGDHAARESACYQEDITGYDVHEMLFMAGNLA